MDYYKGLDTLMSYKGLTSSESFSAWYQEVIAPYETQELDLTGFDWDLPQVDFTYEQLEIEGQLKVMATYVDAYSEPIPLGTKGIGALHGSIPRHKALFRRDEGDMRAIEIARQKINASVSLIGASARSFDEVITESLAGALFELTDGHVGTLNYQRGQMASGGKVTLTNANNPRGLQGVTFDAQVPDANFKEVKWYKKGGQQPGAGAPKFKEDADPVGDLRDWLHPLIRKYRTGELEVQAESFHEMMKHPKCQLELGYLRNPVLRLAGTDGASQATELAKGIFEEEQQTLFRQLVGIPVKFNNVICGVEKWDRTNGLVRTQLDAFNPYVFAFRPTGAIGTIKNVIPMRPDRSAISSLIYGGRGIIEYRYDAKQKVQEWVSELTALCVPNRPKDMFFLKVGEASE